MVSAVVKLLKSNVHRENDDGRRIHTINHCEVCTVYTQFCRRHHSARAFHYTGMYCSAVGGKYGYQYEFDTICNVFYAVIDVIIIIIIVI